MKALTQILWLDFPEEHDYPAAGDYLRLLFPNDIIEGYIGRLQGADISMFKAKDIFRASCLSLLGVSNMHVKRDQKKIKKGILLSPLLLVRDPRTSRVIIADGYHRLCAIYSLDEDAMIPCQITD
ncbi:hypothetical protein H7169_01955 [Candidatus Gracilibacteria bacterium]|nr:hypothetical protein [Candidatus Gracilibacteria bacterium]